MPRERGRVVGFNNAEGQGGIRSDAGDELYVHFAHIDMDGFKTLRSGQLVEFERVRQPGPEGERDEAWFVVPVE